MEIGRYSKMYAFVPMVLAHCPPSSEWGPSGSTRGIKVMGMELATLAYKANGPGQGIHVRTVYGTFLLCIDR